MKNKLIAILTIFLSAATLAACASETETAEIITTTEYTVPVYTTPEIFANKVSVQYFDTYDELMNEYNKSRSVNYVHPLPDIVNTWETRSFSLCSSNYTLRYRDAANETDIMLEIGYSSSYSKISDYIDGSSNAYGKSEIVELTDRYAVKHYIADDDYAIIGITGDSNIKYTLVINPDGEGVDIPARLKEYMELLEL